MSPAAAAADTALLGAGNDTYVWNPGDGSDIVEGQAGTDTLLFNGANVNEKIDISANGGRARFTRDVANITMDLNGVEHIQFNALGGADTITVNDLTGTSVKNVDLDLSSPPGSGVGDGQADTIIINATSGADVINVSSSGGVITVSGLAATVTITGAEAANDRLVINGLGGDDVITASGLTGIQLTAKTVATAMTSSLAVPATILCLAGLGDDVLIGGPGHDILDGGPGDNIVIQDGVCCEHGLRPRCRRRWAQALPRRTPRVFPSRRQRCWPIRTPDGALRPEVGSGPIADKVSSDKCGLLRSSAIK